MKKKCKGIDIENPAFIEQAIYLFLKGKTSRRKTARFFCAALHLPMGEVKAAMETKDARLQSMVATVAAQISAEIRTRSITLRPISYSDRVDPCSKKVRRIGVQSVKQSILDHVAVLDLRLGGATARVGEWQCASIPGRGCVMGAQRVSKWLRDPAAKHYVKLDVRKCYDNIAPDRMLQFFRAQVKNPALLWLLQTLLAQHATGLSIGSYLSQWCCNLYLSQLWHYMAEHGRIHKRGKVVRLFTRQLYYMDDLLFIGPNKRHLALAARMAEEYLGTLGLQVKPWQVKPTEGGIDMMGFRCRAGYCTIRRRIFRRIRRTFLRASAALRTGPHLSLHAARKIVSYHSYIKHTASVRLVERYGMRYLLDYAATLISKTTTPKSA